MVPERIFFTRGVGVHEQKLVSFELALRSAEIAQFNLVGVSSILPPGCRIVEPEVGLERLRAGEIVFSVLAKTASNEVGRDLAASIGAAWSSDRKEHGYLAEHVTTGENEEEASKHAEHLALSLLETSGQPVSKADASRVLTKHVAIAARVSTPGSWTTVVAAGVFC